LTLADAYRHAAIGRPGGDFQGWFDLRPLDGGDGTEVELG
jgi:hypothetical protein